MQLSRAGWGCIEPGLIWRLKALEDHYKPFPVNQTTFLLRPLYLMKAAALFISFQLTCLPTPAPQPLQVPAPALQPHNFCTRRRGLACADFLQVPPTASLSPMVNPLAWWSVPGSLQHPVFSYSYPVVSVAATASHRRQSSPRSGQRPARLSIALPPCVKGSGGHQGTRGMKIIAWSVCTVVRALSRVHQGHGCGSPRTHTRDLPPSRRVLWSRVTG